MVLLKNRFYLFYSRHLLKPPSFRRCNVDLGGSALRTTQVLKQMGTEVLFFSACGDDRESSIVAELLKKNDMDTRYVETTSYSANYGKNIR